MADNSPKPQKHPQQSDFYERLFEDDSYQVKSEPPTQKTKKDELSKSKRYPVP